MKITLPSLHEGQAQVRRNPARFRVLSCGRRWGKTLLGTALCLETGLQGGRAWWIAPSYKVAAVGWRGVKGLAQQIPGATIQNVDRMVTLPGGGTVQIRSADDPDSLRGDGLNFVVIDEAAYIKPAAWTEAIRPALSDRKGGAMLISTPRGRNHFWELYQRGLDEQETEWASFQFPTVSNPFIDPLEIEEACRTLPELIYRQEYLAEFIDDQGGVFRRVQEAAVCQPLEGPEPGRQYIAGVDVAASVDYTVTCVLDVEAKRQVYMDRFNRVDYPVLESRLAALYHRWNLTSMTVEANSIGRPVIDHLHQRGLSVNAFTTTNATKQVIIQNLQSAFEHEDIKVIDDPVLVGELLSFEGSRTSSGAYRYAAPEGLHDDCVMSLAIGWHSANKGDFDISDLGEIEGYTSKWA